jgi:hypothetical protein
MNPLAVILAVLLGIGAIYLIVALARRAAERERLRIAGLANWASRNGFTFAPQDPFDLDARFNGTFEIGRGHGRYAFEVLSRQDPVPCWMFRYHFKTWETRTVTTTDSQGHTHTHTETYEETHWRAYLIVELQAAFPPLAIRGETWLDKVAGFVGFDDIDFESEEFSRRYFVKSADKQFAYAVIHPQMMEWLLAEPFTGQLDGGRFIRDISGGRFDAGGCEIAWSQAAGFINRIPPFVWQDYGKRPRVELPAPAPMQPEALAFPPPAVNPT